MATDSLQDKLDRLVESLRERKPSDDVLDDLREKKGSRPTVEDVLDELSPGRAVRQGRSVVLPKPRRSGVRLRRPVHLRIGRHIRLDASLPFAKPAIVGSVLLHLILIGLLFWLLRDWGGKQGREEVVVEIVLNDPSEMTIEEPPDARKTDPAESEVEALQTRAPISSEVAEAMVDDLVPTSDPVVPLSMPSLFDVASILPEPSEASKTLSLRRTGKGRQRALDVYSFGHGGKTEVAVKNALQWLKDHQNKTGSWGEDHRVAMTGLALLTFLSHGETPQSEDYGKAVQAGMQYLVDRQRPSGGFETLDSYEHAIATYALAEAYALTGDIRLYDVLREAVKLIILSQHPGGGWDYRLNQYGHRDLSILGWQIQALKSAQLAGVSGERVQRALDRAKKYVLQLRNEKSGLFGYSNRANGSPTTTGVGILCLQFLGEDRHPGVQRGIQALRPLTTSDEDAPQYTLYAWYYITQAKFHYGGEDWRLWNDQIVKTLLSLQRTNGSWLSPGTFLDIEEDEESGYGPVYATTLAALTLQVYYRYLPTYSSLK